MTKKSTVSLEMFPAKEGDSFLLSLSQTHILIDCGFTETYQNFIKSRLQALAQAKESLALLVITHIDEDHIQGALQLLTENKSSQISAIIPIQQIWHNAFRHLPIIKSKSHLLEKDVKKLERAMSKGASFDKKEGKNISAKQGSTLGKEIMKGRYDWNSAFDEKAISTNDKTEIHLPPSVKMTLLSPNHDKLERLAHFWKRELYKMGLATTITEDGILDDAFELLLKEIPDFQPTLLGKTISKGKLDILKLMETEFKEDKSERNGSSIAFIVEFEEKRLLFLADAHPTVIEQGLERIFPKAAFPIHFDCIKVAHHGSFYNNSPSLLHKIDAPIYAISTDGVANKHPSIETLAWIVGRPTTFTRQLYFNYPNDAALLFDDAELKKAFKYETHITRNNHSTIISI